jgi:hypothetical protein
VEHCQSRAEAAGEVRLRVVVAAAAAFSCCLRNGSIATTVLPGPPQKIPSQDRKFHRSPHLLGLRSGLRSPGPPDLRPDLTCGFSVLAPRALEKSSITDQISFLTTASMSLRQNCFSNILQTKFGSARCRDMGDFHRHYLLHRRAQECLDNLQPKSGCALPMHSLLKAKFFCR